MQEHTGEKEKEGKKNDYLRVLRSRVTRLLKYKHHLGKAAKARKSHLHPLPLWKLRLLGTCPSLSWQWQSWQEQQEKEMKKGRTRKVTPCSLPKSPAGTGFPSPRAELIHPSPALKVAQVTTLPGESEHSSERLAQQTFMLLIQDLNQKGDGLLSCLFFLLIYQQ